MEIWGTKQVDEIASWAKFGTITEYRLNLNKNPLRFHPNDSDPKKGADSGVGRI